MTEPFNPNDTPLLLSKVRADRLLLVVPAETLIFVNPPPPGAATLIARPLELRVTLALVAEVPVPA